MNHLASLPSFPSSIQQYRKRQAVGAAMFFKRIGKLAIDIRIKLAALALFLFVASADAVCDEARGAVGQVCAP